MSITLSAAIDLNARLSDTDPMLLQLHDFFRPFKLPSPFLSDSLNMAEA
jgi:hypothetical protein